MCMAAGIDPPAQVLVHGWLLASGEKMSKSRANQISPRQMTDDFGVDALRYYLLRDTPFGLDGDFSYEGITARYNADLANNLGNLLARVTTVVSSKCDGIGPRPADDSPLRAVSQSVVADAGRAWQDAQPHLALESTWRLIRETNAELEATEPWKAPPGPVVDGVLGSALEALRIVALLVAPAMPASAGELWRRLGLEGRPEDCRVPLDAAWGGYPGGRRVVRGGPLFPRRER
jgi:methionyl-tRNA synthetase